MEIATAPKVAIALPTLRQSLLKKAFSFPAMLAGLLMAAVFVPLRDFNVDPGIWWHMKVGEAILATHHWPTADTYSFTVHGAPWVAYEWLGEVLLAWAYRAGGLRGLLALDLAMGAAILLALYALASQRSRNSKAGFVACGLLLALTIVFFTLRPQMLGDLFLILTLIVLERFRQGHTRTLWLLPPLFMLWVNTHASFVAGLFAIAVYGLCGLVEIRWGGLESVRWTAAQRLNLGLALLASVIGLVFTPYGPKLAGFPLDMAVSHPMITAGITEWQPLPFNVQFGKLFLLLVVGFLLAQIVYRFPWQLAEMTPLLCGMVAACLHVRFLQVFVPFCAPLLAVMLSRWIRPYEAGKDKFALNAILMTAIVVGVVRFFPSRAQLEQRAAQHWPVKAVEYLERHSVPQPLYNNYAYGGYLIHELDGRYKVFIDGRAELYERTGILADYASISEVRANALALLWAYNVQSCLIERGEALATLLAASSEWQKVYADDMSVLFVRRGAGDSGYKAVRHTP